MARKSTTTPVDHGETIVPLLAPRAPRAAPMVASVSVSGKPGQPAVVGDLQDAATAAAVTCGFDGLPWGLWQARTALLSGLCKMTTAWHMATVLYASVPSPFGEFVCAGNASGSWWDWSWEPLGALGALGASPWTACDGAVVAVRPSPNATDCIGWLDLLAVNQWSTACHRQFVGGVSQLCYLLGVALGGAFCMRLTPRAGPRTLLLAALGCEAVLALLLAAVQIFWAHCLIRFLLAIASATLFTAAAVLSADVCAGRSKMLTTSLFEIWWSLGILSISAFGLPVLNWTSLQALLSLPSMVLLLPCVLLLPESPRWLVARGRTEQAAAVWERGAAVNGQGQLLPPRAALTALLNTQATAANISKKAECSAWSRGESGRLRHVTKVAVLHIAYGCVTNTFFGSILNVRNWGTPGMLGLAMGEAAAAVTGILGFFLGTVFLRRCSRPLLLLGLLLILAGTTGMLCHLVEDDDDGGDRGVDADMSLSPSPRAVKVTLFALVERVAVATAVPVLTVCGPQLVAAPQRTSLVFSCLLFGRICLLAAPFVGNLVVFGEAYPLTVFGIELITAGLCSLVIIFLDLGKATPQKMEIS